MIQDEPTRKQFKVVKYLAIAMMIVAPLLYAAMAFAARLPRATDPGSAKLLLYILIIVAIGAPMLYPMIERFRIDTYRRLGDKSRMTPMQLYVSLQIVRFAMVESIFILALVVLYVSGRQDWFWDFYPIGIVWVIWAWPTETKLEKFLQRVEAPRTGGPLRRDN